MKMPRFSGYGYPFQYYRPYNYRPRNYVSRTPTVEATPPPKEIEPPPSPTRHAKPKQSVDPVWFDLFGIKLYFDDVLILSLLFFLYKEEVKDEGLFLALVLLLIS